MIQEMAQSMLAEKENARPPYVSFELRAVEDLEASRKAGRYIAKDVEFIRVKAQGGTDDTTYKVEKWLAHQEREVQAGRFPARWLEQYKEKLEAWRKKQEIPLHGTPILGWPVISPAQQEMLLRIDIRTVEDLSAINDEAATRIGMGYLDLKNKAKAWLDQAKGRGPATQEIAALKRENRVLVGEVETLKKQVETLQQAMPLLQQPNAEAK